MTVNTLDSHESRRARTVAEWLWPFVPMAVSVFSGSALVYYHLYQHAIDVHSPLQRLYAGLYRTIGFAPAVMFFGLTMVWSTIWLAAGRVDRPLARFARLLAMTVMLGVFLNLGDGTVTQTPHNGVLGAWLAQTLVALFGHWPSLLLVWGVTFASLLLATDFGFYDSFEKLRTPAPPLDVGVETAVTDHFRALAQMTPAPAPAATPVAPVPARVDASPIDIAVEEPAAGESPPRRRTYAERRAERQARSRGAETEVEWVPAAPDNQEIEDPETRPARANAATAPVDAPKAPAPEDDLFDLPPLAEEDEDDDVIAPAAEQPEVLVPSSRHEPIVFPDDEVPDDEVPDDEVPAAAAAREHDDDLEPEPLAGAAATHAPASDAAHEVVVETAVESAAGSTAESTAERTAASTDASADASEVDGDDEDEAEAAPIAGEPVVAIPRLATPPEPRVYEPPAIEPEPPARQQNLFGAHLDETLVQEAIELVTSSRRASVAFLQRKLRIDYPLATDVLGALAARGVVALDGDATQGRVLG
jgi:hypothetical protein